MVVIPPEVDHLTDLDKEIGEAIARDVLGIIELEIDETGINVCQ